jgi:uncharacterized protein (TIRG00374 family)
MLAVALRSVDFPAAWKYASKQNDWFLVLAAALLAFQIACGAGRWHVILRALNAMMPFIETCRIYYIGAFFGTCMVASVGGDVARVWLMYRNNISAGTAAISVILDRVAAVAGVAIIVLAVTPFFVTVVGRENILRYPGSSLALPRWACRESSSLRSLTGFPSAVLRDFGCSINLCRSVQQRVASS